MYKIFLADKDAYITNKVVKGSRLTGSNVGGAGTLDLFKLYGASMSGSTPNVEISRILIHFDLNDIKDLHNKKKIDVNDPSFYCKMRLMSVYGGQPTPSNFTVQVFPLSASFREGVGRDIVYYSDNDVCNWMSGTYDSAWFVSGCAHKCYATGSGDYITSSLSLQTTKLTQYFEDGTEDLVVDVTKLVSATISGEIRDEGFRISFDDTHESDKKSYFVKRFASRTAYDESMRPIMTMGFDDSVYDDTQNLTFDSKCRLSLYNYFAGQQKNIVSGSTLKEITGSNCLLLRMLLPIPGGQYELTFTGSQLQLGSGSHCFVSGAYFADFTLPSYNSTLKNQLLVSSSLKFTPVWSSFDKSVGYVTGSEVIVKPPSRTSGRPTSDYYVNIKEVKESYATDEEANFRVEIFDRNEPYVKLVKIPVENPGKVLRNAYYGIREAVLDKVVVPFDSENNSTKISSDSDGMFFEFDMSSLLPGTYVFDVMIDNNGIKKVHRNVSPVFKVENLGD